jgi:hypothetical protein
VVDLTSARHLAEVGFKLEPKAFGLPEDATSAGEQENAARIALEETTAAISDRLTKLEPFMSALRQRVTLALRLAHVNQSELDPEATSEMAQLVPLLAAVGNEMPRVHQIGSKLAAFALLARNRANHSDPAAVGKPAAALAAELQSLVDQIQERLKSFPYPFPHARGRLTVAEYARFEKPVQFEWQKLYDDCNAHLERLFALHYRLIGRILAHAAAGENKLEKLAPK